MIVNKKEKDGAALFNCCSSLEEKTCQLYRKVAERIEHPDIRALLIGIAYDSFKHSKIVRELGRSILKPEEEVKKCEDGLGELCKAIINFSTEITETDEFEDEDLTLILKDLVDFEDVLSENYSRFLQRRTLQDITEKISELATVDEENLKSIIETIIEDKEKHRETLIAIVYLLAKTELKTKKDNTPMVKFQNPNGWNRALEA